MPRVQIYKLSPTSMVITDFIDLPGDVISNDMVDYKKPPVIPDDLQRLFAMLAKEQQPAKVIVCEGSPPSISHENRNGWSMCQSAPVIRRRLGDAQRTAFLAPNHTP